MVFIDFYYKICKISRSTINHLKKQVDQGQNFFAEPEVCEKWTAEFDTGFLELIASLGVTY